MQQNFSSCCNLILRKTTSNMEQTSSTTTSQIVEIVPNTVWVLKNILTAQECSDLIQVSEGIGYHQVRNGTLPDRVKYDSVRT